MMGGAIRRSAAGKKVVVNLSEQAALETKDSLPTLTDHLNDTVTYNLSDKSYRWINMTQGVRGQHLKDGATKPAGFEDSTVKGEVGDIVRFFWTEEVVNEDAAIEVTISPNTFPGTYKIVGDTFMRSEKTGKDEPFQFIIGKAKVLSEVTITLEAISFGLFKLCELLEPAA